MSSPDLQLPGIRFGEFVADFEARELYRDGAKVRLQGQPFEVLALLLDRPGRVVTRDEFRGRLWPTDTFVDFEHGLNAAVNRLREALGDSADAPRYIETLHRRGYRFIGSPNAHSLAVASPDHEANLAVGTPSLHGRLPLNSRFFYAVAVTLLLAAAALFGYTLTPHSRAPQILRYVELTRDSQGKTSSYAAELTSPVVSDGSQLYFMAGPLGNRRLMQVSTAGGETTRFAASIGIRRIVDASPASHQLLVLSSDEDALASESPLFVLPLPAGAPYRVGDILAHDANWSLDGTKIVYAYGHDLYVAKSDGTESHKLAALPGAAWWPRWSPDGKVLRFTVLDALAGGRLWEVSSDGKDLHRLFAENAEPPSQCCGNWTVDGRYFVFTSAFGSDWFGSDSQLWAARERAWGAARAVGLTRLSTGPLNLFAPLPGTDGKRIFAVAAQPRGQLVRYDPRIGQFRPFLSGISAQDVDFTADGQWVTYVLAPEGTLWRSRSDGSERLQLTLSPLRVSLPRWSPDGKRIAFLAQAAARTPFKIHLISRDGGSPEQAIAGDANEGEPSWSPDGNSIAFGPLFWLERNAKTGIYLLDLATRRVSPVPESQGLFSARWSPDGRFIAALTCDSSQTLTLFDLKTYKRTPLVDKAAYPNWSRDGRYIYSTRLYGADPGVYRVRGGDGKVEKIATLDPAILNWSAIDKWTGLAPDDSPLVLRDTSVEEIYALEWQAP